VYSSNQHLFSSNQQFYSSNQPPTLLCACPNAFLAPSHLKYTLVNIGSKQLTAMLDTGCSKTVILRSALPGDIYTSPTSTILLCANAQKLNADVTDRNVCIKFNENLTEKTRPLVTDQLSCDLIIGIDCLRNFSYKENEDIAFVNGKRIGKLLMALKLYRIWSRKRKRC